VLRDGLAKDPEARPPSAEDFVDRLEEALGDQAAARFVLHVGKHDGELGGAPARKRVGLAQAASEAAGRLAHRVVARGGEPRELHQYERDAPVAPLREVQRLPQPVIEEPPVGQLGQRVVVVARLRRARHVPLAPGNRRTSHRHRDPQCAAR
jgi:hypothetical protein